MKAVYVLSSLICICFVAVGCAAPTAGEEDVASVAQAEASEARLLALGDSIAFGYNPFGNFTKDKNFTGYPDLLKSDYAIKNASCPGETSGSLFSTSAPDNGCRNYRAAYPLHVNYGNKPTQLDYALNRLTSNDPGDVPTLITLNVGGNDYFLLAASCGGTNNACYINGAFPVAQQIAQNMATIFSRLRGEGGYQGPIIFQNLYALNAASAAGVGQIDAYLGSVAHQLGAQVADAFGAFYAASGPSHEPCAAGLLIPIPGTNPLRCDVHPTPVGQQLLADAVLNAQ